MHQYKFSICTLCYNGENLIHRVYNSLKKQTYRDFEWIIVNDASTDGTDEIVKEFIKEAEFPIQYTINEKNMMVNYSIDKGVQMALGELFILADCDDEFVDNALEKFLTTWDSFSEKEKESLSGVVCNTQDQYGNFVGTPFPQSPWITDDFEMRFKHKIRGEKWGFKKTEIIKQYSFFVPECKRITVAYVWNQIAAKYKSIYINDILRIYYINENTHESEETKELKNPAIYCLGNTYYYRFMLNEYSHLLFKNSFIVYLKYFIHYINYAHLSKIPFLKMFQDLRGFQNKTVFLFLYLPGLFLTFLKKAGYRKQ